jgi:hypothetical protein
MSDLNFELAKYEDIIREVNDAVMNPPSEVSVNIILKGNSAKKFHIVKTILTSSYPELDEEEIDAYIVRSGIHRELEKLSSVIKS